VKRHRPVLGFGILRIVVWRTFI